LPLKAFAHSVAHKKTLALEVSEDLLRQLVRHVMRTAVQLWVPLVAGASPLVPSIARDMRRAYQWRGFDRIWLLPWIERQFRWSEKIEIVCKRSARDRDPIAVPYSFQQVAIKGERFERIDIIHVDAENRCFAPGLYLPDSAPDYLSLHMPFIAEKGHRLPKQLYRQWISSPAPKHIPSKGAAQFVVPWYDGKVLGYARQCLSQKPGPIEPIDLTKVPPDTVWPPPGANLPPTVSREAESIEFYGDLAFLPNVSPGIVIAAKDRRMRALHVNFEWSPPFDQFFQHGGGADLRADHERMLQLATDSKTTESDLRSKLEPYYSEDTTIDYKAWFWPRLCADGVADALVDVYTRFGIDHESVPDLLGDPRFGRIANNGVSVQQLWGWAGYFWWEFLMDLQSGERTRTCENCGGLISGTARKRFCDEEDSPQCYRNRRTASRRSQRVKQKHGN